ncbi:MAG: N-acyl homoserine lactonase family protein [Alphaproteobacteria bacterium]
MTVRLFAMTCGWLTLPARFILDGTPGELRLPIPGYLIVHPKGKAVFDSGLHTSLQTDPSIRLGKEFASMTKVEFKPGEELGARLSVLDVAPQDVTHLINSHLHFDHSGGNDQIPNAQVVIQKPEWEAGMDPDLAAKNGFDKRNYDLGHDVKQIHGEHDLFGDGSVTLIPTYGHTPGHQSMKVKLAAGDVVLTGDACYMRKTLEDLHLPHKSFLHNRESMLASLQTFRDLQKRGARIFYGHDAEHWAKVPQAPLEVL